MGLTEEQENKINMLQILFGYAACLADDLYAVSIIEGLQVSSNHVNLVDGQGAPLYSYGTPNSRILTIHGDKYITAKEPTGDRVAFLDIPKLLARVSKMGWNNVHLDICCCRETYSDVSYIGCSLFIGHSNNVRNLFYGSYSIINELGKALTPAIYNSVKMERPGIPGVSSTLLNVEIAYSFTEIAKGAYHIIEVRDGKIDSLFTVNTTSNSVTFGGVESEDKASRTQVRLTLNIYGRRVSTKSYETMLYPTWYERIGYIEVSDHIPCKASSGSKWESSRQTVGLIDLQGTDIIPLGYWEAIQSTQIKDLFIVKNFNDKLGIVGKYNAEIVTAEYSKVSERYNGIIVAENRDTVYYFGNDAKMHTSILEAFPVYRFKDTDIYAMYVYNAWMLVDSKLNTLKNIEVTEESRGEQYWNRMTDTVQL